APQILAGVLQQGGKLAEATAVLDYASRWYVRAEQWLAYGGIAQGVGDTPRTAKAFGGAYQLDPEAFDLARLHAYASLLDEAGDYATCEKVANQMLRLAGVDLIWQTVAWDHLACAYIGLGKFDLAIDFASKAAELNPLPEHEAGFATTL